MKEIRKLTHFHDELNPDIWRNDKLRLPVQVKLLEIAREFDKFIGLKNLRIKDITVSGSNAAFNYTDSSDIDLHLVVDYDVDDEKFKELFDAKKKLFNEVHDITIKGHDVEVYVQSFQEKHISNGVYSILKTKWIKFPEKIPDINDETNIKNKYNSIKRSIISAINSNDKKYAESIKHKIKKMRVRGLASTGEFGAENLSFKLLRNEGYIDKLHLFIDQKRDKELSLESALKIEWGDAKKLFLCIHHNANYDYKDQAAKDWIYQNFRFDKSNNNTARQIFMNILKSNKQLIIGNLLKMLKDFDNFGADVLGNCQFLKQFIDWPELNIIVDSANKMWSEVNAIDDDDIYMEEGADAAMSISNRYNLYYIIMAMSPGKSDTVDYDNIITKYFGNKIFITSQDLVNMIELNKKLIIGNLLMLIKNQKDYMADFRFARLKIVVDTLKTYVTWPELDVIYKAMDDLYD